jgi:hypothetical protein
MKSISLRKQKYLRCHDVRTIFWRRCLKEEGYTITLQWTRIKHKDYICGCACIVASMEYKDNANWMDSWKPWYWVTTYLHSYQWDWRLWSVFFSSNGPSQKLVLQARTERRCKHVHFHFIPEHKRKHPTKYFVIYQEGNGISIWKWEEDRRLFTFSTLPGLWSCHIRQQEPSWWQSTLLLARRGWKKGYTNVKPCKTKKMWTIQSVLVYLFFVLPIVEKHTK